MGCAARGMWGTGRAGLAPRPVSWPPLHHGRSRCRGAVVDGLRRYPGMVYFTPKFGLEMYEKE